MMIDIMEKVQQNGDTDNDGIPNIYGMVGSGDELAIGLLFSNDAYFFDYNDEGKLVVEDPAYCASVSGTMSDWIDGIVNNK